MPSLFLSFSLSSRLSEWALLISCIYHAPVPLYMLFPLPGLCVLPALALKQRNLQILQAIAQRSESNFSCASDRNYCSTIALPSYREPEKLENMGYIYF